MFIYFIDLLGVAVFAVSGAVAAGRIGTVVAFVLLPLIGVLVYLIARGGSMQERAVQQAQQQDRELRSYVRDAAGSPTTADQLTKLADLRNKLAGNEKLEDILADVLSNTEKLAQLGQETHKDEE